MATYLAINVRRYPLTVVAIVYGIEILVATAHYRLVPVGLLESVGNIKKDLYVYHSVLNSVVYRHCSLYSVYSYNEFRIHRLIVVSDTSHIDKTNQISSLFLIII